MSMSPLINPLDEVEKVLLSDCSFTIEVDSIKCAIILYCSRLLCVSSSYLQLTSTVPSSSVTASVNEFAGIDSSEVLKKAYRQVEVGDLIGASAERDQRGKWVVYVYAYVPCTRSWLFGGGRNVIGKDGKKERRRMKVRLELSFGKAIDDKSNTEKGHVSNAELESRCYNWVNAIQNVAQKNNFSVSFDVNNIPIVPTPPKISFLVFLNPISGSGNSERIWKKVSKPMLQEANIKIDLIVTTHGGHACEVLQAMSGAELQRYNAVLTIGGDGIIFEVLNGLFSRPDGVGIEMMKTLKLCPIPGGTSNGLVKSILYDNNEIYSAVSATFLAIKGIARPMDLSLVRNENNKQYISFLSFSWGLVSDIDILSEKFRCLGSLRIHLAAVYFICAGRQYRGRLKMKLVNTDSDSNDFNQDRFKHNENLTYINNSGNDNLNINSTNMDNIEWNKIIEDKFQLLWVLQTSHAQYDMLSSPRSHFQDGVLNVYVCRHLSTFQLLSLLLCLDTGGHDKYDAVEKYTCTAYQLEPLKDEAYDGIMALDGEVIDYVSTTGIVIPNATNYLGFN